MIKVCFYLENGSIPRVDLSNPPLGNPGCGGTEYAMASLVFELAKKNALEIVVLSQAPVDISSTRNFLVQDLPSAIKMSKELNGYLVYRANIHLKQEIIDALEQYNSKVVPWMHVTPTSDHINKLGKLEQVVAIVSMSDRQYLKWADSEAGTKTVNIYNGQYPARISRNSTVSNIVTYLGALVPQKGFHLLSEAWPKILSHCPDAQLFVIGSGGLYRESDKMGPHGIAEEQYESRFMRSLVGYENSVTFHGRVSNSMKDELIAITKVGVVNPSGLTENCPASALDFQSSGVPVVAAMKNGLIDTVEHKKTGLLVRSQSELVSSIVILLQDSSKNTEYSLQGPKFVESKFSFDAVSTQWLNLFQDLETGTALPMPKTKGLKAVSFMEALTILNLRLGGLFSKANLIPSIYQIDTLVRRNVRKIIKRSS